jgi:hypothetical protein
VIVKKIFSVGSANIILFFSRKLDSEMHFNNTAALSLYCSMGSITLSILQALTVAVLLKNFAV